jgi:hypothetical protein
MSEKHRYITVSGHKASHMMVAIQRNGGKIRSYDAFCCEPIKGKTHFFSPTHRRVRARRIALCAIFFVELAPA